MTPREYVEAIVLPTLHEFLAARDDRRRAYIACLVICHVADSLGLAEAALEPGFEGRRGRSRKDSVDAATKIVQGRAGHRCGGAWAVVQGFANGTKHPARLPLLPGTEHPVPMFDWETHTGEPGEITRWEAPGLTISVRGRDSYVDICAQQVLAGLIWAYPEHLGGIDVSFMDPGVEVSGFDMAPMWLIEIGAWAAGRTEVAEVWLFGSRAKGTARIDSDVDLGLVLVAGDPGHDWPEGNYQALGDRWQAELAASLGRRVSLVTFARPGEPEDDDLAAARAPAILLWARTALPRP